MFLTPTPTQAGHRLSLVCILSVDCFTIKFDAHHIQFWQLQFQFVT